MFIVVGRACLAKVLFTRPRQHGANVRTNFVCCSSGVAGVSRGGICVDPVEKLSNLSPPHIFERYSFAPGCPLSKSGRRFIPASSNQICKSPFVISAFHNVAGWQYLFIGSDEATGAFCLFDLIQKETRLTSIRSPIRHQLVLLH